MQMSSAYDVKSVCTDLCFGWIPLEWEVGRGVHGGRTPALRNCNVEPVQTVAQLLRGWGMMLEPWLTRIDPLSRPHHRLFLVQETKFALSCPTQPPSASAHFLFL